MADIIIGLLIILKKIAKRRARKISHWKKAHPVIRDQPVKQKNDFKVICFYSSLTLPISLLKKQIEELQEP